MVYDLRPIVQTTICNEIDNAIDNNQGDNIVIEISRMLFAMLPSRRYDFNPLTYTTASNRKVELILKENSFFELTFSILNK